MKFRSVIGSFRILRKRLRQTGRPGLMLWTDCGEKAAQSLGGEIRAAAHAAEINGIEARRALAAGLAGLADGRIDPEDLAHFSTADRFAGRVVDLGHDIGEAVRS